MIYKPCEEWIQKLYMHIGDLSSAEQAELEKHLQSCLACSQAYTDWKRTVGILHALPAPKFPAGLPLRLLAEMETSPTVQQSETNASRQEIPLNRNITYQLQYRKCGKASCSICRNGLGHGPYWYAYWREGSRLRSRYVGKVHPALLPRPVPIKKLHTRNKEAPDKLLEEGRT